jgi:hypothetical protein
MDVALMPGKPKFKSNLLSLAEHEHTTFVKFHGDHATELELNTRESSRLFASDLVGLGRRFERRGKRCFGL